MLFSFDLPALSVVSAAVLAPLLSSGHDFLFAMMANSLSKEAQRGIRIPLSRQQKVDGLAYRIDCPVQIFPLTSDFDVRFVHALPTAHVTFVTTKGLIQ